MRINGSALAVSSLLAVSVLTGCGGSSLSTPVAAVRSYQGTASVGDFLTISVDPAASTIDYTNHTNGQTGTLSYTVGADGAYNITTPNGGITQAYEIPGFALVANANNTGPQASATSLVTAILQAPISLGWLENKNYNYMQWRTSNGGMEIGDIVIDGSANVTPTGYSPFQAMQAQFGAQGATAFQHNGFTAADFTADPSGNFLTLTETQGTDTLFATQGGFFVVDMDNGSLISVPQAAASAFDPTTAGTYQALSFNKANATLSQNGNTEVGTGTVVGNTLSLTSEGVLTVLDATGATVSTNQITAVADTAYLQGPGTLANACPGLFTYRIVTGTVQQDVYLEFLNGAMLFCSYSYDTSQSENQALQYSYYYGVGLKQ